MSDPMIFTFLCLLAAHVAGDFVFQSNWMVQNKHRATGLAAHGAVVAFFTAVALGGGHWTAWALIVISHIGMDWIKARLLPAKFWTFAVDQAMHIAVLGLVSTVLTRDLIWLPYALTLQAPLITLIGLTLASMAGGPIIGYLMKSLSYEDPPAESIQGAGRMIGILERGLIFGLIIAGEPGAVGFLIAAKSVLRFGTIKDSQAVSEYVIIGTLASFAWAFAVSYLTLAALAP